MENPFPRDVYPIIYSKLRKENWNNTALTLYATIVRWLFLVCKLKNKSKQNESNSSGESELAFRDESSLSFIRKRKVNEIFSCLIFKLRTPFHFIVNICVFQKVLFSFPVHLLYWFICGKTFLYFPDVFFKALLFIRKKKK